MSPIPATVFARLSVDLGERSYPIIIGDHLLTDVELFRGIPGQRIAVVTNTVVAPLYLERLSATLNAAGKQCIPIVLPDGEEEKNVTNLMAIFTALLEQKCDRKTTLLALGGGVIGDMTGFAAATYMRGVPFVQVPTTLLAQVDSSVGGKTAINHPLGKNMIGAFHQPRAVVIDLATLRSLSSRELRAGLAEVVKYAVICDPKFFDWLESNAEKLLTGDVDALGYAIHHSCKTKATIVARDEREHGERALLNFGHTFGHAIESVTGYSRWLHGEAVAAGMLMATSLSERCGLISGRDVARVALLLQRLGLRTETRGELTVDAARRAMSVDKKVKDGRMRLILLRSVGQAFVSDDYPTDALTATLEAHLS